MVKNDNSNLLIKLSFLAHQILKGNSYDLGFSWPQQYMYMYHHDSSFALAYTKYLIKITQVISLQMSRTSVDPTIHLQNLSESFLGYT